MVHRFVDVFEEPAAQREQLVGDADDVAAFDRGQQRGDQSR